jgi:hypothetical protein
VSRPHLYCPDPAAPVPGTACVDLTADEAIACYERLAGPLAAAPPRAMAWTAFRWLAHALILPPRPLIPVLPTLIRPIMPVPGLPPGAELPRQPRPPATTNPIAVIHACRERRLAEWVQREPAEQIVVVYGAGHFPGFVAALRERDPAWRL